MRRKSVGWMVGSLGVLLGVGPAWAEPMATPEAKPECRDAGVTVSFASASSELDTNARGALNGVATWMKMRDGRTIRLQGTADKKGSASANQRLSQRRAEAVKDYLLGQGIEPERIRTVALGEESDHLSAGGRTVAVVTCEVPTPVAEAAPPEPEPEAAPEPAPPPAAPMPLPAAPMPLPAAPMPPPIAPAPRVYAPVTVLPPPPPPPPLAPIPPPAPRSDRPASGLGIEGTVGGGVIGFANADARNLTATGGEWEARMTFGSRLPIAFEAAYVGSAQGINVLGLSSNALLLGNGAEGTLRVNFTTGRVQPYLFGGGGFTHYQVTNTNTTLSSVSGGDNIGTVPTGLGLSARLAGEFLIDIRGTYRFAFNDTLLDTASTDLGGGAPRLDTWNVAGKLGFEF